jgi:hypothetical protein
MSVVMGLRYTVPLRASKTTIGNVVGFVLGVVYALKAATTDITDSTDENDPLRYARV